MRAIKSKFIYAPILKGKLGELTGLDELSAELKPFVFPVIVPAPCWEYDQDTRRPLTPAEHVSNFGPRLAAYWGKRPVAVDAHKLDDDQHCEGLDDHPLTALLSRARNAGATAIPVVDLGRSDRYLQAAGRIIAMDRLGAVIRLGLADLEEPDLEARLTELLSRTRCDAGEVMLLVDLSSRTFDELDELTELLIGRINTLPYLLRWQSLFLAASEFPELKQVKSGELKTFRRGEWLLREKLIGRSGELVRTPSYSDYAVEHPWYAPTKRGPIKPSVHLRVTTDEDTVICKAASKSGFPGMKDVCTQITKLGGYPGENFSFGARFIARCSSGEVGCGDPKLWRAVGHNHHMTKVIRDLAVQSGLVLAATDEAAADVVQDDLFVS